MIFWGGRAAAQDDASHHGQVRRVAEDLDDASIAAAHDASRLPASRRAYQVHGSRLQPDPRRPALQLEPSRGAGVDPWDSLVYASRARLTDRERVTGAKPAVFCRWMFDLLGAQAQDDLVDLFPGSGGVARAWGHFTGRWAA